MEKIVIGIDESDAARSAVEWVAQRCARREARVHVVNVVWDAAADSSPTVELLAEAERTIHSAAADQTVTFHRAEGPVAQTLAEYAAGADLLVIGVDPDHPLRAAVGGWLPIRVIARSVPPVCVVPAGWRAREGSVAVGLDDDLSSNEALTFAAQEAASSSGRLRVVHAWRLPDPALDGTAALLVRPEQVLAEHREVLEAATRSLRRRFPRLLIESDLSRSRPADALLDHAAAASMIVIGTHREGVLTGGYFGSIAQDILWQAGCPIIVVPSTSYPPKNRRHF